jgi:hypothetical protein
MQRRGTDPYDSIAPIIAGTLQGSRRQALRALFGAGTLAGVALPGWLRAAEQPAGRESPAANALAKDPLANDRTQDWARPASGPVQPGKLPFVRVWCGPDRITRIEQRDIELTGEPTPGLFIQRAETFAIRVIPPGTTFDWHKPSRRRMVSVLRGRSTITLRDGTTAPVLPGTLSLVENLDSDGHRGAFDPQDYTLTMDVGLPLGA